jgi:hypothetical protein
MTNLVTAQWSALLFLLCLAPFITWLAERSYRHGAIRRIIDLPRAPRMVALALIAFVVAVGSDKSPVASSRLFNFITAMRNGSLIGGERIASAAQVSALDAFNAQTDSIIASATQIVANAESDFIWLEAAVTNFGQRVYITCDLPYDSASATNSANIEMRAERHEVGVDASSNLILRVYISSSAVPLSAPVISYELSLIEGTWLPLTAVTNTFPDSSIVQTMTGFADAYRYDYMLPPEAAGVVLIPTYSLPFGGYATNALFEVNGIDAGLLVSTNETSWLEGRTGWARVPGMPYELELSGGIVVGYREVTP